MKSSSPHPTQLMGILNVTPDSCFDGGRWFDHASAIQRGIEIYAQGADWIDIGGESSRPYSQAIVSEEEELRRVLPVIQALKSEIPIPISIDTMKPKVAQAAIEKGASFINDISGFRDPAMRRIAAESQLPICVMHMHETPATMQINPIYPGGIIPFLLDWFKAKIEELLAAGVHASKIILDPGIGFGKTVADNIEIVHNLDRFKTLGFPLLIGLSRKSFLGRILNKTYPDLLPASIAVNTIAILANIEMIRVHDVAEHRDIIDLLSHMNLKVKLCGSST